MRDQRTAQKSTLRTVALAVVALIAAGCVPYWEGGASVTVSGLTVSWPAAVEVDDNEEVAYYHVWVDGVPAGRTTATNCTLQGLAGGTTYTVTVRIIDTAGESSATIGGSVLNWGTITAPVTPGGSNPEMVPFCAGGPDTDGDGLPDIVESNSGTYVSLFAVGSDPNNPDTDGDGISDGDETLGTTDLLHLPALGTSPLHEDLLLEYDWFDDANDCAAHSHRPTPAMIAAFTAPFNNAPRTNPDGVDGVNVINDFGQGGAFTGGNLIADSDGVLVGGVGGSEYLTKKTANFAANRNGYFHYVMLPHRYNTVSNSSGQAEITGDDLIVSLQCSQNTNFVANTIAHEVGHNLGLRHGGFENQNWKPNYNSVMNYRFQFFGIDIDCDAGADTVLDFSIGNRISLDENNLDENQGTCGGTNPIDWNGDGNFATGVATEINMSGSLSVLHDYNDWANLNYGGIGDNDGAPLTAPEIVDEQPTPELPD